MGGYLVHYLQWANPEGLPEDIFDQMLPIRDFCDSLPRKSSTGYSPAENN